MVQGIGIEDSVISFPEINIGLSIEIALRQTVPQPYSTFIIS